MTFDSSIISSGVTSGAAAVGAGAGAGFSAERVGAGAGGVGVTASAFAVFSLAGAFLGVFSAGYLGAAVFTARVFLAGAASPSGLAVFFVDEVAMPGEGGRFRSWRL
jgi:hypothetical protein